MKYFHRNYFFLLTASALTTAPVSYTHLDVYKRQVICYKGKVGTKKRNECLNIKIIY